MKTLILFVRVPLSCLKHLPNPYLLKPFHGALGFQHEFWEGYKCSDHNIPLQLHKIWGFPGDVSGKEPTCQCRRHKRHEFDPWVGKITWRMKWQPTLLFLPGESHGQECGGLQSTVESDTTQQLNDNNNIQNPSLSCVSNSKAYVQILI